MKTNEEIAKNARERAKRQNEKAKENWDSVTVRLPKGTKEKITAAGESVNGLINRLVLEWIKTIDTDTKKE